MALSKAQLRQRSEAGKKGGPIGGAVTVARYGHAHMRRIGLMGGRPTWQQALAKELARNPKATLNGMRRRPRIERKESGQERAWALVANLTLRSYDDQLDAYSSYRQGSP